MKAAFLDRIYLSSPLYLSLVFTSLLHPQAMAASVTSISLAEPEQRTFHKRTVPHAFQWEGFGESESASDAVEWLKKNRATVDEAVIESGAVLFRGFPLKTAEDFDAFVGAFEGCVGIDSVCV